MKSLRRGWKRLIGTITGSRHEPDPADEIETHLQTMTVDNLRIGMSTQEARRAAVLKFGGVESAKEFYRDQRGFPLIGNLLQDIRFAFRMLHRTPSVSVPAILVLALGIGTATALYAVVYAMWLRPLPFPEAGRLVSVTTYFAGYKLDALASPDYGTWQGTRSLGALAAYNVSKAAMIGPGETVEVGRANVSGNLLDVLRIHAAVGRGIQPADEGPEAPAPSCYPKDSGGNSSVQIRTRLAGPPGSTARRTRSLVCCRAVFACLTSGASICSRPWLWEKAGSGMEAAAR